MPHELTHASFFSGVGGLDLGLERAGWRTVSFSEIDPYACAVLAERWPGVPNLGDIVRLAAGTLGDGSSDRPGAEPVGYEDASRAYLWSGGFPCQDLSVAGKRRGMGTEDERTRSGLAYAFLDLVERHRPPAILLENVPGLLSSNGGKDFGALLGRLGELGYWWAYRILDAQFFGVPQRRRRVFICAFHAGAGFGADSAAAVLSVSARCDGHSAAGDEARPAASDGLAAGIARSLSTSQQRIDADTESFIVRSLQADSRGNDHEAGYGPLKVERPSPDPGGVREADGLAGRVDDLDQVGPILTNAQGGQRSTDLNLPITLNGGSPADDDPLLPLGLDSHRYRCAGNGVVSNVSEWIGVRLARAVAEVEERAA